MNKIKIIHVVKDDKKFFSQVLSRFDSDARLENHCVMLVKKQDDAFMSIPPTSRVKVLVGKNEVKDYFSTREFDCVFFYSLPFEWWYVLDYIKKPKKVIWWSWGYELYEPIRGMKPLIDLNMYKTETFKLFKKNYLNTKSRIIQNLKKIFRLYYYYQRNKMLRRIDYYQPVISIEYELIKNKFGEIFKAEEFYYKDSRSFVDYKETPREKSEGFILLGNSSSYTNNHIDVWKYIKQYKTRRQNVIVPLNYGDKSYAQIIKNKICEPDIVIISDFMERNTYFNMLEDCSYFVSGVLRQQSLGNILYCLRNGIKVFLYKDSILFKYLTGLDVKVYAIEDIDSLSLDHCISESEHALNLTILNKESIRRNEIYEKFIKTYTN